MNIWTSCLSGAAKASEAGETAAPLPVGHRARRRRPGVDGRTAPEPPAKKSGYVLDAPARDPGPYDVGEEPHAPESLSPYGPQGPPDAPAAPPTAAEPMAFFGEGALMEAERPELDFGLMWDKQLKAPLAFAHFQPGEGEGDAFGIKLVSVTGSASNDSQMSESGSSGFEYESADGAFSLHPAGGGGRGKRFLCSICNRTYATSQNLEVHMRIHTGERPFSCHQCGKKFTQSAHLKSHTSIHSGERPHLCRVCGRSFIVRYSLKLHMKKCHPDVPND